MASEFRRFFNGTVVGLEEAFHTADDLHSVEEVIEVKQVECSDDVKQFTSTVFVGLQGDLDLLTAEEKATLEQTFQESYNALSFQRCPR